MTPDLSHIAESLRPLASPIDAVTNDPDNARINHDIPGIASLLKQYGQQTPLVADKKTGHILKGNGTYKAAQYLGWGHIAISWAEFNPAEAKGYAIGDNRAGDRSQFDDALLTAALRDLDPDEIATGFTAEEIAELLSQADEDDAVMKDVELRPPPKMTWVLIGVPTVQYGRISPLIEQLADQPNTIIETAVSDEIPEP